MVFSRGGYTLKLTLDQLDNVRFPHSGGLVKVDYFESSDAFGADFSWSRLVVEGRRALSSGANSLLLVGRLGSSLNTQTPFYQSFRLGGLFNLSAMPAGAIDTRNQVYMRAQYYRQIRQLPALVGKGVYAGALLETGWGWDNGDDMTPTLGNLPWSAGGYLAADTFLGSLYLLGALGGEGEAAIYMALGANF
jgi:NTE family protein